MTHAPRVDGVAYQVRRLEASLRYAWELVIRNCLIRFNIAMFEFRKRHRDLRVSEWKPSGVVLAADFKRVDVAVRVDGRWRNKGHNESGEGEGREHHESEIKGQRRW